MTVTEWLKDNWTDDEQVLKETAMAALNVPRKAVTQAITKLRLTQWYRDRRGPGRITQSSVKTLGDFRAKYGYQEMLEKYITSLVGDTIKTESDVCKETGIPIAKLRGLASYPGIIDHNFRHDNVTYWAAAKTIVDMKNLVEV